MNDAPKPTTTNALDMSPAEYDTALRKVTRPNYERARRLPTPGFDASTASTADYDAELRRMGVRTHG